MEKEKRNGRSKAETLRQKSKIISTGLTADEFILVEQQAERSHKTKYEIHRAVSAALPKAKNWEEFIKAVYKQGVKIQPKFKANTKEVQGISFEKNGYTFKSSEIDRKFSFGNLDKQIKRNAEKEVTQFVPVCYTAPGGIIRQTQYESQYTPPPVENIALIFSNLLDGLFESYYSPAPDDAFIRDMDWRLRRKKRRCL